MKVVGDLLGLCCRLELEAPEALPDFVMEAVEVLVMGWCLIGMMGWLKLLDCQRLQFLSNEDLF